MCDLACRFRGTLEHHAGLRRTERPSSLPLTRLNRPGKHLYVQGPEEQESREATIGRLRRADGGETVC